MRHNAAMTDPFAPPSSTPPERPSGDPFVSPASAPAYGEPVYGAPYAASAQPRNGFGTTALVLGILSVLTSFTVLLGVLLGVLAITFGFLGRSRAKRKQATNGGMAIAGILTGVAGTAIAVLIVVAFLGSDRGRTYLDCVRDAVTTEQTQVCQDQLTDSFR